MRSFTECGTFSFVCLLKKKNRCIWESATHKLLYTQSDVFRMSSSCTVNMMSNASLVVDLWQMPMWEYRHLLCATPLFVHSKGNKKERNQLKLD